MNKNEFLNKLFESLEGVSSDERERLSQYFAELFLDKMEEGLTEEEAVASLGKPEECAELIKQDLEGLYVESKDVIDDMQVLFEGSDIDSFDIITEQTSVVIRSSSNENFRVSFLKGKEDKIEWFKEGDCFVLRHKVKKELFDFFRGQKTRRMYIEVPKNVIEKFRVQNANARITLNDISVRSSGEIITSNAKICVMNYTSDSLLAKTSNARIEIHDSNIKTMKAKSCNDKIIVKSCEFNKVYCHTCNAKIEYKNNNSKDVELDSCNAGIFIDNITAEQIKLSTSNAGILGTICGTMEDYIIDCHTRNGSCRPMSRVDEKCHAKLYARTYNASINIRFNKKEVSNVIAS